MMYEYDKSSVGGKFFFERSGSYLPVSYSSDGFDYEERSYRDGHWVSIVRKDRETVRVISDVELAVQQSESGIYILTLKAP